MKKCSEEMQTLCAGCSKAEPEIFAAPQTPFPGAQDGQLIGWRWSLSLPTNPFWWGLMHAISSYHGNRPTHAHTHKQTGPTTIHCTAASAQCNHYRKILMYQQNMFLVNSCWNRQGLSIQCFNTFTLTFRNLWICACKNTAQLVLEGFVGDI